jgi:shikimate kinase
MIFAPGDKRPLIDSGAKTRAVILIGFMGAGKSSVGRALAAQLAWTFEDLDERIERREGKKVAEIFRDGGEAEFRRAEHMSLKEAVEELRSISQRVIALGGGAFVHQSNARLIEAANIPTVFLDAGVEELWARCKRQSDEQGWERPLLGSPKDFRELYEKRRPYYLRASLTKGTGGKSIEEVAAELIQALGLGQRRGGQGEK